MWSPVQSMRTGNTSAVRVKVTAAIPCLNTQSFIAGVVSRAKKYVDEVIVVDDGSSDSTAETAGLAGAVVVKHSLNKGYGEAIKSCFTAAGTTEADVLVTLDGDGQHDPDQIPQIIAPVLNGEAELVIGSRFLSDLNQIPFYRKLGISLITFLWNFGSGVRVSDAQSGFRAYRTGMIRDMYLSERGMSTSIEILERIRRGKFRIREIPISCSYINNNSSLTMKALRHGLLVILSVVRIRLKRRFTGKPGRKTFQAGFSDIPADAGREFRAKDQGR